MSTNTPFVSDIERQRARTDINADFYAKALRLPRNFAVSIRSGKTLSSTAKCLWSVLRMV